MTELRDLLARALAHPPRCDHAGGDSCDAWHRADAAMPAVATWLRSLAEERLQQSGQPKRQTEGDAIRRIEANVLELYSRRLDPEGYARAVGLSPAVTPPSEGTQE